MALDTYANLKTSIAGWLNRSNLTAVIPDFITLAEARFNREIRAPEMETRASVAASSEYVALPTGFLGMRSIYLAGSPDRPLDYFAPQHLKTLRAETAAGQPAAYTIVDDQLLLVPAPSASPTLEMVYFAKIPALSDANTTNWLLTDHPDLYLSASLAAAEAYIWNDERLPMWRETSTAIIDAINAAGDKKRRGSAPLVARGMQAFS